MCPLPLVDPQLMKFISCNEFAFFLYISRRRVFVDLYLPLLSLYGSLTDYNSITFDCCLETPEPAVEKTVYD